MLFFPNLFLTYTNDAKRSAQFYADLFEMEPCFESPRYIAFEIAPTVLFAVWSGSETQLTANLPRTSEVGLMLSGGSAAVDELFGAWSAKGVRVVESPYDEVFGRTFVIADPDGNLIRVSPMD